MQSQNGMTLIELMVAVAVVGILTSIALPSYSAYVFRSRIPAGLDALAAYQTRMEQAYQDTGTYGTNACTSAAPQLANFTLTCGLSDAGQGFVATVTGIAAAAGVSYSVDHEGTRRTLSHPKGIPAQACWSIRGDVCDS